jgi:hypothetical protein
VGTGALSVTNFDRDITVTATGDDGAYLGLVPDSEFAEIENNKLGVSFDRLNADADTSFRNVFYIQNNGNNDLRVQLTDGGADIGFANDSPMVVSYSEFRDDGTAYSNLNAFPNSPNWLGDLGYGHAGPDSADANTGFLDLTPGETAFVHFDLFLKPDNSNSLSNTDVPGEGANPQEIGEIPEEIGFYASAVPEDGDL